MASPPLGANAVAKGVCTWPLTRPTHDYFGSCPTRRWPTPGRGGFWATCSTTKLLRDPGSFPRTLFRLAHVGDCADRDIHVQHSSHICSGWAPMRRHHKNLKHHALSNPTLFPDSAAFVVHLVCGLCSVRKSAPKKYQLFVDFPWFNLATQNRSNLHNCSSSTLLKFLLFTLGFVGRPSFGTLVGACFVSPTMTKTPRKKTKTHCTYKV
jgi:hypothetical protein